MGLGAGGRELGLELTTVLWVLQCWGQIICFMLGH